ncbi:MAG: hypothetical protein GY765_01570, partial [bacterium]|nr:hypothetical protein [bacterium]
YIEALRSINRFVHTVKGTAAFMELFKLKEYCHMLEELTLAISSGSIYMNQQAYEIIFQLPSVTTRFFDAINNEYSDKSISIEKDLEEITLCKDSLAGCTKEKIRLNEIHQKDFGIIRHMKRNIKLPLELHKYDLMVHDYQTITHNIVSLMESRNVPANVIFDIGKSLNVHLEDLVYLSQTPIALSRYQRIVLDLGRSLGKKIAFAVSRNEAFARPDVWDRCHHALIHLVRNAVDHGIELPEQRRKQGKSPQGTICLSFYEDHKNIYIDLEDDGCGIDPEKVAQSALTKEIVTPAELDKMSTEEIQKLIFKPGFSTKLKATDVSGRGVGMDAVLKEIETNLNGRLTISSEKGVGSRVGIEFPKAETLSECIFFGDENYTYAIPKTAEVQYLELQKVYLKNVMGETPMYTEKNLTFPILDAMKLLHPDQYGERSLDLYPIIKIGEGTETFGLVVPKVMGHRRIKIERRRGLKKIVLDDGAVFGYGLTNPVIVVLDLDYLKTKL